MTDTPERRAPVITEVCVDSASGARAAWHGGADRIELCAALEIGGLTPSEGLQEQATAAMTLPVHVLVRPRQGDFCFDALEIATMETDIARAVARGCAAVVTGVLTAQGTIDRDATARLRDAAAGSPGDLLPGVRPGGGSVRRARCAGRPRYHQGAHLRWKPVCR